MVDNDNYVTATQFDLPKGFIIFISGVPGVGKTTISYQLLKNNPEFRIIEETDILRDALRGYNEFLAEKLGNYAKLILDNVEISSHTKLLSLEDARQQCLIMKKSLEGIVVRQQRKGISSIINGVHIIPEVLKDLANNPNIIFVNLYISDKQVLHDRILGRNPDSYMLQHIPFIFQSNLDLFLSTEKLVHIFGNTFSNIDVARLNYEQVLFKIYECIRKKIN